MKTPLSSSGARALRARHAIRSTVRYTLLAAAAAIAGVSAAQAATASLTGSSYTENFDELTGTSLSPAAGWSVFTQVASGAANNTWTNATGIPASGTISVATMTAGSTSLIGPENTASSLSGVKNSSEAYNVAADIADGAASSSDRALATSPTVSAGMALQLTLTNNSGRALSAFQISYDIDRFTTVGTANELPGYQLFYSVNGSTWTNVSALNPTIATVPNTVGVTSESGYVILPTAVANGSNLELRWVDDDAQQTSPDQMIGLNNVEITPVPLPAAAWLMLSGLAGLGALRARRRGEVARV